MIIKKLSAVGSALTFIAAASALPFSPSADCFLTAYAEEPPIGTYDSMVYEKFADHIEILGCDDMREGELIIPGEIEGLPVTVIGEEAFEDCEYITSVVIPDSVTTIRESAFYDCDSLAEISIPESVTNIGGYAFTFTPWMKSRQEEDPVVVVNNILIDGMACEGKVVVPDGVRAIGDYSFVAATEMTSIVVPDSVRYIGECAFGFCVDLTSVELSNSVETIEAGAFVYCISLQRITLPYGVSYLKDAAFGYCPELKTITIMNPNCEIADEEFTFFSDYDEDDDGREIFYFDGTIAAYEGSTAQAYAEKYGRNFVSLGEVPECISGRYENLRYDRYSDHTEITGCDSNAAGEIVIPDRIAGVPVTVIADLAFVPCNEVTNIIIPDSVTTIGKAAFSGCDKLTSITIPDSVTSMGELAFENCRDLTSVKLSSGMTKIEESMFSGCENLVSVIIPDGIESIERGAFDGCKSLTSVTLPDSVTSIGDGAFIDCKELSSVKLSKNLTAISGVAFSRCESLKSVVIPESVTTIGPAAFMGCESLESIFILNPDCYFDDRINDSAPGVTIYGYTGSTAQAYAEDYKMNFSALDEDDGLGDVNGDGMIDAVDASEVLAEYARLSSEQDKTFDDVQFAAADVNMDGFTDAVDASNILAYYAYLSVSEGTPMPIRAFLA